MSGVGVLGTELSFIVLKLASFGSYHRITERLKKKKQNMGINILYTVFLNFFILQTDNEIKILNLSNPKPQTHHNRHTIEVCSLV